MNNVGGIILLSYHLFGHVGEAKTHAMTIEKITHKSKSGEGERNLRGFANPLHCGSKVSIYSFMFFWFFTDKGNQYIISMKPSDLTRI